MQRIVKKFDDEKYEYCGGAAEKARRPQGAASSLTQERRAYFAIAFSVTALVKAPTGSFEITGSEPPVSNVLTVRW